MHVFLFFLALLCLRSAQALMESDEDDCVLHLKIHKVLSGDPYYRIFNGNEEQARSFANARWRKLLSGYDTIAL